MCNCQHLSFTGPQIPRCGCQGHHPAAFDGSGINNEADTLDVTAAMALVRELLVCPHEIEGLELADEKDLVLDRYAKMRYYFDQNRLALTEANIRDYKVKTLVECNAPQHREMLLERHPLLKTGGFVLVLLALSVTALYFLTREA